MTKKDFVEIQTALADGYSATTVNCQNLNQVKALWSIHASTCRSIANVLSRQNAKFDRMAFMIGCRATAESLPANARSTPRLVPWHNLCIRN